MPNDQDKYGNQYQPEQVSQHNRQVLSESFYVDLMNQVLTAYGNAWEAARVNGDDLRATYLKGLYDGTQESLRHFQEICLMESIHNAP